MKRFITLIVVFIFISTAVYGKTAVISVKANGNIQDAVNTAKSGDSIEIAAGTYRIKQPVTISDKGNISIIGKGDVTIISDDVDNHVIDIWNCNNILVKNIKAHHIRPQYETCSGGVIGVHDCDQVNVENCELNGCGIVGIWADNVKQINLTGCYIHHNSWVALDFGGGVQKVVIKDCKIINNAGYINHQESTVVTMEGNNTTTGNEPLTFYNNVIQENPDVVQYYVDRGTYYTETMHQAEKAVPDFLKAVSLKPNDPYLYWRLGRSYVIWNNKPEPDKAIASFTKAIELDPKFADAYRDRADCYLSQGMDTEAMNDLEIALKLDPDNAWIYVFQGRYYLQKEKFDEAIAKYSIALNLEPDNPDMAWNYMDRGDAYLKIGKRDEAIKDYQRSYKLGNEWALNKLNELGVKPE